MDDDNPIALRTHTFHPRQRFHILNNHIINDMHHPSLDYRDDEEVAYHRLVRDGRTRRQTGTTVYNDTVPLRDTQVFQ